jgi:exonuclease VII small subunit
LAQAATMAPANEVRINTFLARVYLLMFVGLAVTGVVSHWVSENLRFQWRLLNNPWLGWGLLILQVIVVAALSARVMSMKAGGAALGTAFAMFDRGIKNKLLKELGEKMNSDESALAVLIEEADWETLIARMDAQYTGEAVVEQLVEDHLAAVEALTKNPETVAAVPEELELAESGE